MPAKSGTRWEVNLLAGSLAGMKRLTIPPLASSYFMDELTKRLQKLKVGKTLHVDTETERQQVLRVAKVFGFTIATRKSAKGGFNCTRMPA